MWNSLFGKGISVYFTSPKTSQGVVSEIDVEKELIKLVKRTKNTLDLAVFEFNLQGVAQAIIDAHHRGVRVRVVFDSEYSKQDVIDLFNKAGIETKGDNRSSYMHNKFFIFDNKCVWTGSFNITENSAHGNNENVIVIWNSKLAGNYTKEFEEMFFGEFGKSSPDNTEDAISVKGVKIENYFSPEDDPLNRITELVGNSKKSVHFLAFSFTSDQLANVLIKKKSDGIEIQGVFEKRGTKRAWSKYSKLRRSGIKVFRDINPKTMHHKIIIIDRKIVILGSYNFSDNARDSNDENILIIHDKFIAGKFESEFKKIYLSAESNQKKSKRR